MSKVLTFHYKNWRGETAVRRVNPTTGAFWFGSTEWHPEPQWLWRVVDLDKNAARDFAVKDIEFAPFVRPEKPGGGVTLGALIGLACWALLAVVVLRACQ